MVTHKNNNPFHPAFWIASLVIQFIAVALFSRFWMSLEVLANPLPLVVNGIYIAIVVLTVKVIRGNAPSEAYVVALGALNVIATILSVIVLMFALSLYGTFHRSY